MEQKLNYEEFFKLAIIRLRDTSKSMGIHSVISGFNEAFREYYNKDPVAVTQELVRIGKIEIRPVKKGVMIYLKGEAPESRKEVGKTTLLKIFRRPSESQKSMIDEVIQAVIPEGNKNFPNDFVKDIENTQKFYEIAIPGTQLQIDPNAKSVVISPKRYYVYKAKNPSEAKYIIYTHKVGQKKLRIPNDNREIFKAVTNYEKYCQEIRDKCFSLFLQKTNDEEVAENLVIEAIRILDLRG